MVVKYPSWERSHIPTQGIVDDDFPFPKAGYVSSPKTICLGGVIKWQFDSPLSRALDPHVDHCHSLLVLGRRNLEKRPEMRCYCHRLDTGPITTREVKENSLIEMPGTSLGTSTR